VGESGGGFSESGEAFFDGEESRDFMVVF